MFKQSVEECIEMFVLAIVQKIQIIVLDCPSFKKRVEELVKTIELANCSRIFRIKVEECVEKVVLANCPKFSKEDWKNVEMCSSVK